MCHAPAMPPSARSAWIRQRHFRLIHPEDPAGVCPLPPDARATCRGRYRISQLHEAALPLRRSVRPSCASSRAARVGPKSHEGRIIVFPGMNRERDMAIALERSSGRGSVWSGTRTDLSGLDLVVIPGGFSYGDYLRCGAMAAQSPVMGAVRLHVARGGYLRAAMAFRSLWRPACCRCSVAQRIAPFPGDGLLPTCRTRRYLFHQPIPPWPGGTRGAGAWRRQLLCRRCDPGSIRCRRSGRVPRCDAGRRGNSEANLNGSARNIAGIYSPDRRILGLMPHLENLVDPLMGGVDGKPLFDALAA